MRKSRVIIRPACSADFQDIASLLDRIFGPKPFEQRNRLWQWRYDTNPARIPEMPAFLVAEQGERIVGVHGLTPMRIKAGEKLYHTSCSCDFAVDPSNRSAGLKIKLEALSRGMSPLHISTSANELANKITLALGGKEFAAGRRKLLKPFKVSGLLQKILIRKAGAFGRSVAGIIGIIAGKPLDWLLAIGRVFQSYSRVSGAVICPINRFDQRFDRLWDHISRDYSILIVRDSLYLNWRYADYPFEGVESYSLVREDELLGYAVIHNHIDEDNLRFTALLELVVPGEEKAVFEHLLAETFHRAMKSGAHYISARTSGVEWDERFRRHGFKVRDSSYSPVTYKNNTDLPDEFFADERKWYVSLGDGDSCYYY